MKSPAAADIPNVLLTTQTPTPMQKAAAILLSIDACAENRGSKTELQTIIDVHMYMAGRPSKPSHELDGVYLEVSSSAT